MSRYLTGILHVYCLLALDKFVDTLQRTSCGLYKMLKQVNTVLYMLYIFTQYILDRCPDLSRTDCYIFIEKSKIICITILYTCWDLVGPFGQQVVNRKEILSNYQKPSIQRYRCISFFHFFFPKEKKKSNYIIKIKKRKTNHLQHPQLSCLNLTNYHVIKNNHVLTEGSDPLSSAIGLKFS